MRARSPRPPLSVSPGQPPAWVAWWRRLGLLTCVSKGACEGPRACLRACQNPDPAGCSTPVGLPPLQLPSGPLPPGASALLDPSLRRQFKPPSWEEATASQLGLPGHRRAGTGGCRQVHATEPWGLRPHPWRAEGPALLFRWGPLWPPPHQLVQNHKSTPCCGDTFICGLCPRIHAQRPLCAGVGEAAGPL